MPPIDAVLGKPARGDRQREGVPAVMGGSSSGVQDLGTLQLAERSLGETAGIQQLLSGEPDRLFGGHRILALSTGCGSGANRCALGQPKLSLTTIDLF